MLSSIAFGFLPELLAERLLHLRQVDVEQLRQDAVVDHVLDEAAQLGVRADLRDDLVERHRIEDQVVAQRVQLQRLVVDARRAPGSSDSTSSLRRLRVHRDEEVDFLLAARCSRRLLARIVYQVGRPAMFDGNRFLPETGTPIWKIDRSRTRLAVWLPDPLTVATWMLKSLTTRAARTAAVGGPRRQLGDIGAPSGNGETARRSKFATTN